MNLCPKRSVMSRVKKQGFRTGQVVLCTRTLSSDPRNIYFVLNFYMDYIMWFKMYMSTQKKFFHLNNVVTKVTRKDFKGL